MRINEAYEHTAMASRGMDSTPSCPVNGCDRTVGQCVDISAPVTLSPNTSIGTPTATCQGQPTVTCTTDAAGTSCEVIMTQQVCVSIPVQGGADARSVRHRLRRRQLPDRRLRLRQMSALT